MNELPLLFSAPMVIAANADIKTMTRRTRGLDRINAAPADWIFIGVYHWKQNKRVTACFQHRATGEMIDIKSPYGNLGTQLWVRETWKPIAFGTNQLKGDVIKVWYEATKSTNWMPATEKQYDAVHPDADRLRPSIHMPRWASRTTLEIVSIRIERLQDITDDDAVREGVSKARYLNPPHCDGWKDYLGDVVLQSPRHSFETLWVSINGRESFDLNPFVWVIEFKRVKPNLHPAILFHCLFCGKEFGTVEESNACEAQH